MTCKRSGSQSRLAAAGAHGAHILLEPVGRNTAPAIDLAARYCLDELGSSPDEILFISPSDHIIHPAADFLQTVRQAPVEAKDHIVTIGVKPDKPETGYGYIKPAPSTEPASSSTPSGKSPTRPPPSSIWRPAITTGIPACTPLP